MEIKIKNLIESDSNLPLPIITNCSEGFNIDNMKRVINDNYEQSSFYQTSKLNCQPFYKTKYLQETNEK